MNYEINDINKVKRVPNRGHYDQDTVFKILDTGCLCHVSFIYKNQPFIIPTLYGREDNKIYLHGAASSRMLKTLQEGLPLSMAVTHLDGIVLARSAFHHSMNYRSVVVYGVATIVKDENKMQALKVISDQVIAGRWEESRQPNVKELKATTILEVHIDQASAKIREGGPGDEKEDYDLDIWAGTIPLKTVAKPAINDELLNDGIEVPLSVKQYLKANQKRF